jgi:N-dimethylarginine dimethylaminohydrolase
MRRFVFSILLLLFSLSVTAQARFTQIGFSEPTGIVLQIVLQYPVVLATSVGKAGLAKNSGLLTRTIDEYFTKVYSADQIKQTFKDLGIEYEAGKETVSLASFITGLEKEAQDKISKLNTDDKASTKTKRFFMLDPEANVSQAIEKELYLRAKPEYQDLSKDLADIVTMASKEFNVGLDLNKLVKLPEKINTTTDGKLVAQFMMGVKLFMYNSWYGVVTTINNQGYNVSMFSSDQAGDPIAVFIRDDFFFVGDNFITNNPTWISPKVGSGAAYAETIAPMYKTRKLNVIKPTNTVEGGDLVYDSKRNIIWAGYDEQVTSQSSHKEIADATGLRVVSLKNIKNLKPDAIPNHLDTHLSPVGDLLLYDPTAFSTEDIALIKKEVLQAENLIVVDDPLDIKRGALNLVNVDDVVIMSYCSDKLKTTLEAKGYKVVIIDVSLYFLGGLSGGIHCMTNQEL